MHRGNCFLMIVFEDIMHFAHFAMSEHFAIFKVVQCVAHIFDGDLKLVNVKFFVEVASEEERLAQFWYMASAFGACNDLLADYFLLFFTQVLPHFRKVWEKFVIDALLHTFHFNWTAVAFAFFIEEKAAGDLQEEGMPSGLVKNQ